jgi:hypothetical protein
MASLIFHVISWPTFVIALVVFGFAPGAVLRLVVLIFRRDDPRRRELLGELYAVPRIERPFWVIEQLEVALFEGLRSRVARRVPVDIAEAGESVGHEVEVRRLQETLSAYRDQIVRLIVLDAEEHGLEEFYDLRIELPWECPANVSPAPGQGR